MVESNNIIYDLLFGEEDEYSFDLSFLDNMEAYMDFTEPIVAKVNRGDVKVVEDMIIVNDYGVYWNVKIKRL